MLETWPTVVEAVYQRITDLWLDGLSARTIVVRENDAAPEDDVAYMRVSPELLRRPQQSMGSEGNRRFEARGVVRMIIHVPSDTGLEVSAGHQQAAVDMFEGINMDGVSFYEVSPRATVTDGRWHMTMVEAMFHYVQVK